MSPQDRPENGSPKRLILMRGLPSSGKSSAARELAEASAGVVCAFDDFFLERDEHGAEQFRWQRSSVPAAHRRHFENVRKAVDAGRSTIVVDADNAPSPSAKAIVTYALVHGYEVEFAEPRTPWWSAIRPLLSDFEAQREKLQGWALKLAFLGRSRRGFSSDEVFAQMRAWNDRPDLAALLQWGNPTPQTRQAREQSS